MFGKVGDEFQDDWKLKSEEKSKVTVFRQLSRSGNHDNCMTFVKFAWKECGFAPHGPKRYHDHRTLKSEKRQQSLAFLAEITDRLPMSRP
ncbi:unnamed protein product [Linum trigynum]|uniref:Uncharacterized protein n=1 Tax=Linum trigynum TaxID=586398 RepID=A0AAV2E1G6_9ROSI